MSSPEPAPTDEPTRPNAENQHRIMPFALSLPAPIVVLASTAVVAVFALILALPHSAAVWQRFLSVKPAAQGNLYKLCVPFLTCGRAPSLQIIVASEAENDEDGVILTHINYDKLMHIVKPHIPPYNNDGVAGFFSPPVPNSAHIYKDHKAQKLQKNKQQDVDDILRVQGPAMDAQSESIRVEQISGDRRQEHPQMAVGMLFVGGVPSCSGIMVAENVMLTANHCLPWGQPRSMKTRVEFVPAYSGSESEANQRPFGSAIAVRCVGAHSTENGIHDNHDMAVCKLNRTIGAETGFLWPRWERPGRDATLWYKDRLWYSAGYPEARKPALSAWWAEEFRIHDVSENNGGGIRLGTRWFAGPGWSGGPLLGWQEQPVNEESTEYCPNQYHYQGYFLGGVVSGDNIAINPNESSTDRNYHVGGERMGAMVIYGLREFDETRFKSLRDWELTNNSIITPCGV